MEEIDLLIKQSDDILEKASETIIEEIERIARNFLKDKNPAYEFTMAMGTYFFSDNTGKIRYDIECQELDNIINKYDYKFSVTGHSMTFTVNSKTCNDW